MNELLRPRHLRSAYGAALLLLPHHALRAVDRDDPDERLLGAARFLGARQLVEGFLPRSWKPALLTVDALHAASMVGFIVLDPKRRTPALATLATTAGLAALTVGAPTGRDG